MVRSVGLENLGARSGDDNNDGEEEEEELESRLDEPRRHQRTYREYVEENPWPAPYQPFRTAIPMSFDALGINNSVKPSQIPELLRKYKIP